MPERFVGLGAFLLATPSTDPVPEPCALHDRAAESDVPTRPEADDADATFTLCIAQLKRLRATLHDASAALLDDLLRDIAVAVLGRELSIAPVDLSGILATELQRVWEQEPIAVRVHPSERASVSGVNVPTIGDPSLRLGDAVIDVRCGSIDCSFGVRVEALLAAYRAT